MYDVAMLFHTRPKNLNAYSICYGQPGTLLSTNAIRSCGLHVSRRVLTRHASVWAINKDRCQLRHPKYELDLSHLLPGDGSY